MFTNIWLSSKGSIKAQQVRAQKTTEEKLRSLDFDSAKKRGEYNTRGDRGSTRGDRGWLG